MYTQQNVIDPSLAALLQTAQMVTPDQTPTVAAQVAQAAQQKMQPQGIMQGMQGAKQDYAAAQPSMMRNMQQQQVQQMMQQAMQQKPAGIEQLPAQNMQGMQRMAGGGVVGYAGPDGSLVDTKLLRMTPEEYERKRREAMARGAPPERIKRTPEEEAMFGALSVAPPMQELPIPEVVSAPFVAPEAQRLMDMQRPPAPRPPAPRPPALASVAAPRPPVAPAPAAPQSGIAVLPARATYDTAGIATAGAPYITTGGGDVGKLREAEGKRAEFEKTLPDLSSKGIEALRQRMTDVEAAEAQRKKNLPIDQSIAWLLGGKEGTGGSARAAQRFDAAQRAAEDAFSQARLGNQQAQLLMEKAQQERQLGRLDRAIALEKEAAALMEKARDNALKAQELAQRSEAAKFQGATQQRGQEIESQTAAEQRTVQMRGQDIVERTAAADRAANAALRNLPTVEQKMAERVMNDWLAKNPGKTLADAWDFYRGAGKGLDQRSEATAEANRLKRQKLLADDPIYKLARFEFFQATDPAKKADAQRRMQEIERASGIADEAPVSTQPPPGVKVTRVGP